MISRQLYLQASSTAVQLQQAALALAARPNSPLSQLNEACKGVVIEQRDTTRLPEVFINPDVVKNLKTISDFATDTDMFTSPYSSGNHSAMIASVVDQLKPVVLAHVSTARNVVCPLVKEFEERMETFLKTAKEYDPATEFTIREGVMPAFIKDEAFKAAGFTYNPTHRITSDLQRTLTFKPLENYEGILNTGNARLDENIQKWLATLPSDFVKNVFEVNLSKTNNVFKVSEDYLLSAYTAQRRNPYDEMAIAIAIYLIATAAQTNPLETLDSVSNAVYQERLQELRVFTGTIAAQNVARIETSIAGNIVVVDGNMLKKQVVVNRDIYRDYLNKGGQPEAMLGMIATSRFIFAQSAALEATESLVNGWHVYVSTTKYKNELKLKQMAVEFIRSQIMLDLENLTAFEKDYFGKYPEHKALIMKKVDEEINHLSHRLLQDIDHTALHIVAKARFYYTGAYDILNEMTMIESSNEDIDPREAANLATMKYVIRYLLNQVVSLNAKK